MKSNSSKPRILIVTPEVTYLPKGMGNFSNYLTARAGGLADVSAALTKALFDKGADVHVTLPNYRSIFNNRPNPIIRDIDDIREKLPEDRIHLAEDRAFFYINQIYSDDQNQQVKLALSFQREVINNIIPSVQPDIIHCNDWMTGLIPGITRQYGIPCLFTVHNIHTVKTCLSHIEDIGVDAASFWKNLYYERMPYNYEETRESNPVDFLASGIFSAHFINTVSPTFLNELMEGQHKFVSKPLQNEITNKWQNECAIGILNAPDPVFDPRKDKYLAQTYSQTDLHIGKKANKRILQQKMNLIQDDDAPLFFWPSRLDNIQKGCQLLADILYKVVSQYWQYNLEIVFIANGDFQKHFKNIVNFHGFNNRIAIRDFNENDTHLAYGASDFILMPSQFEPCGLPQMIAPIYGSLPVAFDTGGIHDTVIPLNLDKDTGNGFLFHVYDSDSFLHAIDKAMKFYTLPKEIKIKQINRIMKQSIFTFNHNTVARKYIDLYENMLHRPLLGETKKNNKIPEYNPVMKVA